MIERKKQIALIMSIIMLSVVLFASFYIISEANHECACENCPICVHIEQFEALLNNTDNSISAASIAVVMTLTTILLLFSSETLCLATPITRKVRMNH